MDGAEERSTPPERTHAVPRDEWPDWCVQVSAEERGRELTLHQAAGADAEVRLVEGQPLVGLVHDAFGPNQALTVRYGTEAVPVSRVIAEPETIEQQRDASGRIASIRIVDRTGGRTRVDLR
jgi:hypothetical protein